MVAAAIEAIRGTTEDARREGDGRPAAERLHVFLRTFVRRLLASGHPRVQRLVQREMNESTGLFDRFVAEAIRPRLEYVSAIVAELLAVPQRRPARPALRLQHPVAGVRHRSQPDRRPPRLRPYAENADALAEHITRFSLGGIRALARSEAPPPRRSVRG